ncbi:MAG: N-acylneuraminate cytidylyltransferase [Deltaproteobacteria bacterium]|nr:MAG: N-acylneuraminate cytidylyltransferase [Deltaproteobacteria bacterium]
MTTVAFIPVRGGSKSIPGKNIRPLAGKPLVHWVVEAALGCARVDRVYVATDSDAIAGAVREIADPRLAVVGRSPETATDTASTESALLEFAEAHPDFDRVVLIQATSPLLTAADLDRGLAELDAAGATSALSVVRQHRFLWSVGADGLARAKNYDPVTRPRRQDWDGELIENGAFYVTSRAALLASGCRLSGPTLAIEMDPETFVELDEPADWLVVESLLNRRDAFDLTAAAREVKLLVTDVDGVLTDGGMYYGPDGEVMKKFSTRDGEGLARARAAGIEVAIMTGEDSDIVSARAKKLGIQRVFRGAKDKVALLEGLLAELGLGWHQLAYIGDDRNDFGALARAGVPACPRDAEPEARRLARFVCTRDGGRGCVRELVDALLSARG